MSSQNQELFPEEIHLPDSVQPDEGLCTLQDFDLTTPGMDLLSGWSSGLSLSDAQPPVLVQGLEAWEQFDHPDGLASVNSLDLLQTGWE